jgi:hypothetical protein
MTTDIHSTQYLYDVAPSAFKDLPYEDAIKFKLRAAKDLHNRLQLEIETQLNYGTPYDDTFELRERVHYVGKAIVFNEALLKELREKDSQ